MHSAFSMNVIKKHVKKTAKQNFTIIAKLETYEKWFVRGFSCTKFEGSTLQKDLRNVQNENKINGRNKYI